MPHHSMPHTECHNPGALRRLVSNAPTHHSQTQCQHPSAVRLSLHLTTDLQQEAQQPTEYTMSKQMILVMHPPWERPNL